MANSGNKFRLLLQADIDDKALKAKIQALNKNKNNGLDLIIKPKAPSDLQSQLNKLSEKYSFRLDVKLDFSAIENQIKKFQSQLGQIEEKLKPDKSAGFSVKIDTESGEKALDALRRRIEDIKQEATSVEKYRMWTDIDPETGENITRATVTYTDNVGKAYTETLKWKKSVDDVGNSISSWETVRAIS